METSSCRPPVSPLLKKYAGERTQHAKGITFHAHFSQPNAPILVLLAFVGKQFWLQLTCTYTLTCVWLTFDYAYFLMKILPLPSSYLFPANRALWSLGGIHGYVLKLHYWHPLDIRKSLTVGAVQPKSIVLSRTVHVWYGFRGQSLIIQVPSHVRWLETL